jgi:hypothetical protein
MRECFSGFIVALIAFGFVFSSTGLTSYAAQETQSAAPYPIAFQMTLRIDPQSNHWYASVTNIGERALTQFGVLIFNSSGYEITANSTALAGVNSLKPFSGIEFKTVCSDYYYSGAHCRFHYGETYGVSVIAWVGSCSCDHEIEISGNVIANNNVYSLKTYPMISLTSSSKVNSTNWSLAIKNSGTKAVSASSEIFWSWNQCNNPSGCYASKWTHSERIVPGGHLHLNVPISRPHRASRGTIANIFVTGKYANFGYASWMAELTLSQSVQVREF